MKLQSAGVPKDSRETVSRASLGGLIPLRAVKREPARASPAHAGFGGSGKSFLIDNLLRGRGSSAAPCGPAPIPGRTPPPARLHRPAGEAHDTGRGSPPSPRDWGALLEKPEAFIPGSHSALLTALSPLALLPCCGGSRTPQAPPTVFPSRARIALWSPDRSPKSRRGILRRAVFSEDQRRELESTFDRQKYISKADRNKLAADLGLKESQVKIWFSEQEDEVAELEGEGGPLRRARGGAGSAGAARGVRRTRRGSSRLLGPGVHKSGFRLTPGTNREGGPLCRTGGGLLCLVRTHQGIKKVTNIINQH
ncbi:hypothetical protein SKAU_G00046380 [Synaphobranchus kaupii]|uniref:Homeobox domain-containing protein n=1 Tax=Synaphobranchus kaupii TaxID=118154 RepID=A0A9Q1J901_SYNKA|nr:hypothetical protein SKAU_G00046380 [Synaphobranchus kaupii]